MMPKHVLLAFVIGGLIVCLAWPRQVQARAEKEMPDFWEEMGPGPGPGPGPEGREARRRWELPDEAIDRVMKSLEKTDPAKAKELAQLRQNDPEAFKREIGKYGSEEFRKIFMEHMEGRRRKWQADYIEWLQKNYPREAQRLSGQKDKDPDDYIKKFELSVSKYGEIFRASRENPELAEVLREDLELKEKRDELLKKIKVTKEQNEKRELMSQLEEVARGRFDLIVRRKEIAYEQLLKKLEDLKQQLSQSREEIVKWKDPKFKDENVKKHIDDLIKGLPRFRWD